MIYSSSCSSSCLRVFVVPSSSRSCLIDRLSSADMHRRAFLAAGGAAAIGFGASACASRSRPIATTPRKPPLHLAPVNASWDRVIRTTVGLRPHRDAGFVLKAEKLDDKLLVHNYGHGGAGMSLAWGTGLMAAEFATEHQARQAAVIGCGSVGLTCATAPATRIRRHDLRARRAAERDVEYVARRVHTRVGAR